MYEHDADHTLEGAVVYSFKTKQQAGAAGSYRDAVAAGTECWAVVIQLNNIYDARRIRACKDLRGPDKFFAVGQNLTTSEKEEKSIIQASGEFRAAAAKYKESTGKWPYWNFATAFMGSDVWTIEKVQSGELSAGSQGGAA